MRFINQLSRKYMLAQKHHSLLTILSITAAVTFITLLFTIFSTYQTCNLNILRHDNPYHATIYDITEEQAALFQECEDIEDVIYETHMEEKFDENGDLCKVECTYTYLMFQKDIEDISAVMTESIEHAGLSDLTTNYSLNSALLNAELIGDAAKGDAAIIFAGIYLYVLFFMFCSRLIIDTAFEISSRERERQFGILQSIGASKKQIIQIILHEGCCLSIFGIPIGIGCGIGLSYVIFKVMLSSGIFQNFVTDESSIATLARFSVSPLYILIAAISCFAWVQFSAYGTGMRIVRMSPIEAIQTKTSVIKKVKKRTLFSLLFGFIGKLSSRNIRRNKKRYIVTILSVTLSMTLFVGFSYYIKIIVNEIESTLSDVGDFEIVTHNVDEEMSDIRTLESSGYFKDIYASAFEGGNVANSFFTDEYLEKYLRNYKSGENVGIYVTYADEATYNNTFDGKPPVPYSQLARENTYILFNTVVYEEGFEEKKCSIFNVDKGESIPSDIIIDWNNSRDENNKRGTESITERVDFKIASVINTQDENATMLLGTIDQYCQTISPIIPTDSSQRYIRIYANLKEDANHNEALQFINDNESLILAMDNYTINSSIRTTIFTVKIFAYAFITLISCIAVINMVNIISTGILNRRSEIAALQSIGMSYRQVIKLLVIESLQYAVTAGAATIILLLLMLFGSQASLFSLGIVENAAIELPETMFLGEVGIAVACAFLVGLIATIIPLISMQRMSITEALKKE